VLGSRINQEKLTSKGSGYVGSHAPDFMKANDGWFRGLRLDSARNGSLSTATGTTPARATSKHPQDRTNGRIYKISYGGPKAGPGRPRQAQQRRARPYQLHANEWFSAPLAAHPQERGPDPAVHAALLAIIRDNPDVTRKLRALWALHVTRGLNGTLAQEFLKSSEPYVRGWTIQLMSEDRNPSPAVRTAFAELAKSDPLARRPPLSRLRGAPDTRRGHAGRSSRRCCSTAKTPAITTCRYSTGTRPSRCAA
jgi:hypothetical protein